MGELEQLARDLGNVSYDSEEGIENLAYCDAHSKVIATQYSGGEKSLFYSVDVKKREFYLSQLQTLTSEISRRIRESLPRIVPCTDVPNVAQQFICDYFPLTDFSEISDIIKLHQRLA